MPVKPTPRASHPTRVKDRIIGSRYVAWATCKCGWLSEGAHCALNDSEASKKAQEECRKNAEELAKNHKNISGRK